MTCLFIQYKNSCTLSANTDKLYSVSDIYNHTIQKWLALFTLFTLSVNIVQIVTLVLPFSMLITIMCHIHNYILFLFVVCNLDLPPLSAKEILLILMECHYHTFVHNNKSLVVISLSVNDLLYHA